MEDNVNRVLIIGNGFDIDLGLKSRYSDFATSQLWIDNIDAKINEYSSDSLMNSLFNAKNKENWFDIEQTMLDYVLNLMKLYDKTNYEFDSNEDKKAYTLVCQLLKQYLIKESNSVSINKKSIAVKIRLANGAVKTAKKSSFSPFGAKALTSRKNKYKINPR